jgi:amino acid adenylation domain-containing protein/non-ribosomal peptide synthase protein (TIGR01720 family)
MNKKNKLKDVYPLSPMQSGFLFQTLYAPDSDAYFVQSIFEFEGSIDPQTLHSAWQHVSNHHPILRTGFGWQNSKQPFQYVLESLEVPFNIEDWSGLKEQEANERLESFIQKDRKQGFDLRKAPIFRLTLIQCAKKRYYLVWSHHHILLDGWSSSIVLSDVLKAYENLRQDKEVYLRTPRPYRDYIAWIQKQDMNKTELFWKNYLSSLKEPSHLSFSNIIKENKEKDYDVYATVFSFEETEKIKKFSQKHNLTLNTVVQGAVGTVLKTYMQQQEIVLGTVISGRNFDLPEIEEMVGLFINTLPFKMDYKPEETILSFLQNLQTLAQNLNEHAYISLAQIQSWSHTERSLFNILFVFENYPLDDVVQEIEKDFNLLGTRGIEKTEYPLTIVISPGKQLGISISYQTIHFDQKIIKDFINHLKQVFQDILKDPLQCIGDISPLTPQERHQLLLEWNSPKHAYHAPTCIHKLFEEQAETNPENIAVVDEGKEFTYKHINERANQLAHYLCRQGIEPDTLVAIAVEKSVEMIIGLLGILKAGGAYVPLDPTYPQARLEFMLKDTAAPILITQSFLKGAFQDYPGVILTLDEDQDQKKIKQEAKTNLSSKTRSHHLAYIIYTSGSTGLPKGAMINHHNIVRLLNETQQLYHFTQNDVWTLFHSYAFDFSVWEIWGALAYGGKLVIVPYLISRSPEAFYSLLRKEKVTVLNQTPSAFQQLIQYERSLLQARAPIDLSLRLVIFGGEALEAHKLKPWFDNHENEGIRLVNMYGITETTVHVTYLPITQKHISQKGKNIIGKHLADLTTYILDPYFNIVPIGVIGELYIGGAGLARGYLNRPDLTAERFIPNPFTSLSTEPKKPHVEMATSEFQQLRLYRTGDLARYLPDGNIEFLGRIDEQVKIRGFRIELGEIEFVINTHSSVAEVVVTAREDVPGDKKLVAYIVPQQSKISTLKQEAELPSSIGASFFILNGESLPGLIEELRNHLTQFLPDYMVPSFFVYVNQLPLTSNGKIDRQALPSPDLSQRQLEDEYVAPQSQIEKELFSIWSDVLKIEKIGIHDNFFRIGGDSIISIQLISRARLKGIYLSVKDIFNYPTIASLAAVAKTEEDNNTFKPDQNVTLGEVPLTPIQHWFFNKNFREHNYFNQSVLLEADERIDRVLLNKAFSLLISHHDALRFRYTFSGQQWKQECFPQEDEFVCQTIDLSNSPDLPFAIERECSHIQQSLDIKDGPVIKAALFDCGQKNPKRLFIVVHHLVVDGVSWRILKEDLERLYSQLAEGKTPHLLPKTHSYQQWALALTHYAESKSVQDEIPFWHEIEEHAPLLPTDFNYGLGTGATASTIFVALSQSETSDLLQRTPKAYRTQINDILLTALVLTIGDWTTEYSVGLALEGHGREDIIKDIDLSRTIGWFTTIFPIHLTIKNPQNLEESIKTVKETLRQIPNKGIGYGVLSYLKNSSSTSLSPSFSQVLQPELNFNYLGQWDNSNSQDGLFSFAPESTGCSVSDKNKLSYLLNINCEVKNGILQFFWTYSCNHYHQETIKKLSHNFINRLKQLIAHCCQEEVFGYTPSDFKLAQLSTDALDRKLEILSKLRVEK